jgi:SAM-dependent methyltransferase
MTAQVFFDSAGDRLVFVDEPASEAFWDDRWKKDKFTAASIRKERAFVQWETSRFLKPPARVLDAGCGLANTVFGLHHAGFDAYGVDFAPETVEAIKQHAPELKIELADVRDMPFEDDFFDGVWSLGVIEHFPEGYGAIIKEAHRVLKPGGLLFLTVPSVTPLRRLKIKLGRYEDSSRAAMERFYQFAFAPGDTEDAICSMGFERIRRRGSGGLIGLRAEVPVLRTLLKPIFARNPVSSTIRRGLDLVLGPVSGHTHYFVFRKV